MERIARFYPVSRAQLEKDWQKAVPQLPLPEEIRLPDRATAGSAGYDLYSPAAISLAPGERVLLPTGVRARIAPGWVLVIAPKSSLGFRYRLQLDNTIGVIDSDYFSALNEGHILIRLTNDSREGKTLELRRGAAVAQGLFLPYGITEDDAADGERLGGFGSTGR